MKNYDPKTKSVTKKRKMNEIEKIRYAEVQRQVTKLCLNQQKILAIFVTFDAKGVFEIFQFGAASEIQKRSQYLAESIRDLLPGIMEAYNIPKGAKNGN